jgi:hypothetical protein
MNQATEKLLRSLLGISSCATQCSCCRMHADIARRRLEEHRASLSTEEALDFDRIFREPYSSAAEFSD